MQKKIHPKYVECKVACSCGNNFVTRATVDSLSVAICSKCHPFYSGTQKLVDSAGRIEKFHRKFQWKLEDHINKKKK